jgi:ABC-2 type transport system permease protein
MSNAFLEIVLYDLAFLAVCVLIVAPLAAYKKVAWAVLKRNFVGYFSNPTGYVFLCLFVLLTSFAAFWPHEFFTANLANLDQLSQFLPYIMLVFIPAITMSVWSEERRQGTDELLLTLPADDFDIVIGKYLAAAAIFTSSLLFSQFSNYVVLVWLTLGSLDTGLFFATYLGYWLIGLAMLSIGMVASFLTRNMTVGFILGAMFNCPLAFAANADVIVHKTSLARAVSYWSLSSQFDDFGRGVLSLSACVYFVLLISVGLYLSMVLIGARHWSGGARGPWMFLHYVARTAALVAVLLAATILFSNVGRTARMDMSAGKISSLSPKTRDIIRGLKTEHPIVIEAFVGLEMPEQYVQAKYSLISLLKEFDAMSGGKIEVRIHENLETFSDEAALAEQRFGITPVRVQTRSRGTFQQKDVLLGAAFTCGLEKVVVPFFDYGVPVEYELIRSIGTVAKGERKKLGVLRTDANMNGGFSFAGGMPQQIPKQEIITELEKQYDVEEVDPTQPIVEGKYDVLMVVQPSSLGPAEMGNLVEAIRNGQPTAIFEDPLPMIFGSVPGTGEPKQAPGGMFGRGQPPPPKADIRDLWDVLELDPPAEPGPGGQSPDVAWQRYNPYPKLARVEQITPLWVFASMAAPGVEFAFAPDSAVTAGLTEVLFPAPGVVLPARESKLNFKKLVATTQQQESAGRIRYQDVRSNMNNPSGLPLGGGTGEQILAAHIYGGKADSDDEDGDDDENGDDATLGKRHINVIYVADVDLMASAFLRIRARPDEDEEINWQFENVTFLLNIIDELAGESSYVEIRMRKPMHATLRQIEEQAQSARNAEFAQQEAFQDKFQEELDKLVEDKEKAMKKYEDRLEELGKQDDPSMADRVAIEQAWQIEEMRITQRQEVTRRQLQQELNKQIAQIRRKSDLEIRSIQNWYKFWAVFIPPIPPLLVGLIVFVHRRLREREGVTKSRLR